MHGIRPNPQPIHAASPLGKFADTIRGTLHLSNLENLNALFINEGLSQKERLVKLNKIAIQQMRILTEDNIIKKIESYDK
jgi:hypothetical protein